MEANNDRIHKRDNRQEEVTTGDIVDDAHEKSYSIVNRKITRIDEQADELMCI